ncbi:MAG: hypothetical protein AAFU64_19250 [Bacteroidota bacterium]
MNIKYLFLFVLLAGFSLSSAQAQSNPRIDRPVRQCMIDQKDALDHIQPDNYSIGHWLGKLIDNCERLQKSSGSSGGPQVVAILSLEEDLDDMIKIASDCEALQDQKATLEAMKKAYGEKKVAAYDRQQQSTSLFDEGSKLETASLPRAAAKELRKNALALKKALINKYK